MRTNIGSGAKWEEIAGYSRAVRVGNIIQVAGTTAIDENGKLVGRQNAYRQTRFILDIIGQALQQAGSSLEDVVRTRIYTTDISHWEAILGAHGEVFGMIRPVATLVEVSALIEPDMLVEIEAMAIVEA